MTPKGPPLASTTPASHVRKAKMVGSLQDSGQGASQPIPNNGKKPQGARGHGNLKRSQTHGYQNQVFNLQLRHPLLKATERQYSIMVKNADPGARLSRFQSHPKDLALLVNFSACFLICKMEVNAPTS